MSEPSVRETAARADSEHGCRAGVLVDGQFGYECACGVRARGSHNAHRADAVLAAVAAHDGLADALRTHRLNMDEDGAETCQGDDWHERDRTAFEAHLADVVRAWLRGES